MYRGAAKPPEAWGQVARAPPVGMPLPLVYCKSIRVVSGASGHPMDSRLLSKLHYVDPALIVNAWGCGRRLWLRSLLKYRFNL